MFESILSTNATLSIQNGAICILASVILGMVISLVHYYTSKSNKNFLITLAVLPLIVQVVIMLVNGNLGTSLAVLGAFSLVRFRSIPGNSKEITSIFFAMAIGLATGMGYITLAILITVVISLLLVILTKTHFGENKQEDRKLKITIPENLDYTNVFDDIFKNYTQTNQLEKVKTTNMGSMYELTYRVVLKKDRNEKDLIDEIRVRNGNLNITFGRFDENATL